MSFIDQSSATITSEDSLLNNVTEEVSFGTKADRNRPFQEKIWASLTKHPNVSVGKEKTFNSLPLSDIEAIYYSGRETVTVSVHRTSKATQQRDGGLDACLLRGKSVSVEDAVSGTGPASHARGEERYTSVAKIPERDEFGFARRQQPALQYRDGRVNLADALKAANPSGFEPAAGDLVAVEKDDGEYSVELVRPQISQENDDYCGACGGFGELVCCDGCSNAFHGACLDPPIDANGLSDDQWYCPRCETTGAQNAVGQGPLRRFSIATTPSTTPQAADAPHRNPAKRNTKTKPKGRPRKFLRGTEHFWRAHISTTPSFFTSRPPNFDATLLKAITNGLPTPADSLDITQNWIDRTLAVLNRSVTGLYISPRGGLQRAYRKQKSTSQIMIIKSARLREVDLSEGCLASAVRFFTSSAAHTFARIRYYPQAKASDRLEVSQIADTAATHSVLIPQIPERGKGPRLGIFYDDTYRHRGPWTSPSAPVAAPLRRLSGHIVSTVGSPTSPIEISSQSHTTSPQLVSAPPPNSTPFRDPLLTTDFAETFTPPRPNGLPPPLTTRAASKRQAAAQDKLGNGIAGTSRDVATGTTPGPNYGTRQMSMLEHSPSHKRQLSDIDYGLERPKKRPRKSATGPSRTTARQQIILDMITRCGGAVTDNSSLLHKAYTAEFHQSGGTGEPDKRTVEATVKALCAAGKLKKSIFSFKDQRGFMVISSIIAKPEVGATDLVMRQLQENIVQVYPNHYTPPGMYGNQTSQVEGNHGPEIAEQPQDRQETAQSPARRSQRSSPLQVIEDEASGPVEHAGFNPDAKLIVKLGPFTGTAWLQGPSNSGVTSGQGLSSGGGMIEDVAFFVRQQQPIVFDSQITSNPPVSITKTAENMKKKVTWRKGPRPRPVPGSLEEILQDGTRRKRDQSRLTNGGLGLSHFESEVDCVARWEERSFNRFQEKNESQSWSFISHLVGQDFDAVRMEHVPLHFNGLTWYDESGQEKLYTLAELKHLHTLTGIPRSPMISQYPDISSATLSPNVRTLDTPAANNDVEITTSEKRKRKPRKTKPIKNKKSSKGEARKRRKMDVGPAYINNPDGTAVDVSGYVNAPVKRSRGGQHLRNMPEAAIYKLTVAIVVVRTLSGGLDKEIDWTLVMRIFPDEDADFARDRWTTIKNKYRRDIAALTENLQDRFCTAYVEGQLPDLDFDDLYNNDWEGVVEWAVRNLDKSCVKEIEDLPDTRAELAKAKNLTFEEHRGMREFLGYKDIASLPAREAAQASTVFAKPLKSSVLQPPAFDSDAFGKEDEQVDVAKSWALATVLTPEETFDAHACKKKLSKLAKSSRASDALFDRALKSMATEKAIVRDKEGYAGVASRGYNASKLFYDVLNTRRTVQATLLQQAARHKREVLDPAFNAGQQVVFHSTSIQDGDMVAILNLLANGRLRVQVGPDVPKNRYGFLNEDGTGSYQTRHLDKGKLSFTVLLEAVEGRYVYGNPMEMQMAPVPAVGDYEKSAIPMWVDIHGNFQAELWELVICAVIGLVSTRPGIDAQELMKTLSPSLQLWEVETVLRWMERCGIIEVSGGEGNGQGWVTTEWWWLICGGTKGWRIGNLS